MKASAILGCMVLLVITVPVAVAAWGLWSLPTALLALAVACLEGALAIWLAWQARQQQRYARFGPPLRHRHVPTHHGPLPVRRGARQRRRAPPGRR